MGTKISALPLGTTPTGAEVIPAVQGGNTVGLTAQQIVRGGRTNTRLAKTALYTAANADKGKTIALGGAAFYALTFSAASGYDADFSVLVVNEDSGRAKDVSLSGVGTIRLYPLQSIIIYNQNNVWQTAGRQQRWKLTAATSFYVDVALGNDGNDGLAAGAGGAFATIQKLLNAAYGDLDFNNQTITGNVAAGTYTERLTLGSFLGYTAAVGYGMFTIKATDPTPSNTKLNPNGGSGIAIFASTNTPHVFKGFQFTNCGTAAIEGDSGGVVALDGCDFAGIAGNHVISLYLSRVVFITDNYTISGSAGVHWQAAQGGQIFIQPGHTVTISGTPAFLFFAYAVQQGYLNATSTTYSGSATGARYNAATGGGIETAGGGANFFPGDTGGTATSPGWYE